MDNHMLKYFMKKLGYKAEGEEFLEENIPHFYMKKLFKL